MRYFISIFVALILTANSRAETVMSCDRRYTAFIDMPHRWSLAIKRTGAERRITNIDHDIIGGSFDLKNKLLAVHGIPNKIDVVNAQTEYLSIYTIKPKPQLIIKRTYGGGIYEISFDTDGNFLFVADRFGFDIINIKTRKVKNLDPASEPPFSRQRCEP